MNTRLRVVVLGISCGMASTHAGAWEHFIGANPYFTHALPQGHGLAVDRQGHAFVQTEDTYPSWEPDRAQFSHHFALGEDGDNAWMWGLVGRAYGERFQTRDVSAQDGARVDWIEHGPEHGFPEEQLDTLYVYAAGSSSATPYDLPRNDGGAVVVSVAVEGGAVALRSTAGMGYELRRLGGWQWQQTQSPCSNGEQPTHLDMAIDAGWTPTLRVFGACPRVDGLTDDVFVSLHDASSGALLGTSWTYPASGERLWQYSLGADAQSSTPGGDVGALLFLTRGDFGTELWRQAADGTPATSLLPPYELQTTQLQSLRAGDGSALLFGPEPDGTIASFRVEPFGFAYRVPNAFDALNYLPFDRWHWGMDRDGNVVAAGVYSDGTTSELRLHGFNQAGASTWTRSVPKVVSVDGAHAQIRATASGKLILAVNVSEDDGTQGIHVEQFCAASGSDCLSMP